eukprot:COSAG01_NODE_17666_length_1132_cov_734.129719_1_plen_67_part_00
MISQFGGLAACINEFQSGVDHHHTEEAYQYMSWYMYRTGRILQCSDVTTEKSLFLKLYPTFHSYTL